MNITNGKGTTIAWVAIAISAAFANLGTLWGIIANFHTGWYFESFRANILLMFGKYLLAPGFFTLAAVIAIRWRKCGAALHLLFAIGAYALFGGMKTGFWIVSASLAALGILYWLGTIANKKIAYILVLALPMLQIAGLGVYHGIRVASRFNDGEFGARKIEGNGISLIWAPQGPGWPDNGTSWEQANEICAHLSEDGKTIQKEALCLWRLPSVNEAVRSQVIHGQNAGGVWNEQIQKASYRLRPDKESPLWNSHRKTIYWWTSSETSLKKAFTIDYNGSVWPRMKNFRPEYLNFRAVRSVNPDEINQASRTSIRSPDNVNASKPSGLVAVIHTP